MSHCIQFVKLLIAFQFTNLISIKCPLAKAKTKLFKSSLILMRSSVQVHADLYTVDLSLFPLQLFL